MRRYTLIEASEEAGVDQGFVVRCLEARWIIPEAEALDDVDLARLRLIATLREDFGVNEEAVPVILHLVDQLQAG